MYLFKPVYLAVLSATFFPGIPEQLALGSGKKLLDRFVGSRNWQRKICLGRPIRSGVHQLEPRRTECKWSKCFENSVGQIPLEGKNLCRNLKNEMLPFSLCQTLFQTKLCPILIKVVIFKFVNKTNLI